MPDPDPLRITLNEDEFRSLVGGGGLIIPPGPPGTPLHIRVHIGPFRMVAIIAETGELPVGPPRHYRPDPPEARELHRTRRR